MYERMHKFATIMNTTGNANLDMMVAVTGRKGTGKTSWAIQVVRACLKQQGIDYFSVDKYIAYDNDQVIQKIHELPEGSPLICDEAARFAMGEDWNKAESKQLKKLAAQIRPKHLKIFLCIPRFGWMDRKYREDMITHWAWIPTRGHSIIFTPDDNPGQKDVWHLDDFKRMGKIDMFHDINKILDNISKHRGFWDYFRFPAVDARVYERYMELRDKHVWEQKESYVDQKQYAKVMLYNLYERWAELVEKTSKNRMKRISHQDMVDFLSVHPVSGDRMVAQNTLSGWVREVADSVLKKQTLDNKGVNEGVNDSGEGEDLKSPANNNPV